MFVYESVPGTTVLNLMLKEDGMEFSVEGPEDSQITVEMEADTEYEVFVGENPETNAETTDASEFSDEYIIDGIINETMMDDYTLYQYLTDADTNIYY